MPSPPFPLTRDLVLIGGGHTHALVLRKWGMDPLPGVRVTLINPGPTAPYSGMLPGHIAGHYDRDALDIDLVRLARFAEARLILGAAQGIDLDRREIHVPGRPPVGFDVASLDIGITSDMPALPGFADHAVPAKPLGPFATAWAGYLGTTGPARVAVIGGGIAGTEIAMAMAHALRASGRDGTVTLVERDRALGSLRPAAAAKLRAALAHEGVDIVEGADIVRITPSALVLADGTEIKADFVTGAAGARPYDWLARTRLATRDGFVAVDDRLRSSDPDIFAVGDCAHLSFDPRPKAGVYAVRQAPVLFDNLRAALSRAGGQRPYKPQRDYLKLISLGRKSALADRFGLALAGPLMWRWKDRIDRAFMDRFRELPRPQRPVLPWPRAAGMRTTIGPKPLCGGCGAKVGSGTLSGVLATLPRPGRDDIIHLPGDDAGLLRIGDVRQVVSTDHLRALVPDPAVMARIAAIHALGDIWAMGAAPQAATVHLILPRLSDALTQRTLAEIMQAASQAMSDAGAAIIGGHSSVGDELTVGFTVTGLCAGDPITLGGARPGDVLILTKPIGSGVIMAAEMTADARGVWVERALGHMVQGQGAASRILANARAMTDVTGFGLAGHLLNICRTSGTGARISADAVPLMDGALELSRQGIVSSLFAKNRAALPSLPRSALTDLFFDPQTAGGLLAAVRASEADDCLAALRAENLTAAAIGTMTDKTGVVQID